MPWENIEAVIAGNTVTANAFKDCSEPMAKAKDRLVRRVEANFASQSAAGSSWTPLAEATLADRARKGFPPGPILRRTSDLQDAATSIRDSGSNFAEVGAPDSHPYAAFHAGSGPRSKIPLRDFLAVDEATIDAIGADIVEHIEKG